MHNGCSGAVSSVSPPLGGLGLPRSGTALPWSSPSATPLPHNHAKSPFDFLKTPLPPISPPKPAVALVGAQGLLAFLRAGRTQRIKPSAGGCANQSAPAEADEDSCSSCSSPAARDPALHPKGLEWTPARCPRECGSLCTARIPRHGPETRWQPQNPCGGVNPHASQLLKQSRGSTDRGPYMGKSDPDLGEHKFSIYLHRVSQGISAQHDASRTGACVLRSINIPLRHLNRSATSRDDALSACRVRKLCPFHRSRRTLMRTDNVHAIRPGRGGLGALLGMVS